MKIIITHGKLFGRSNNAKLEVAEPVENMVYVYRKRGNSTDNSVYNHMGEVSDGDHTFDELYFHRMILFAAICNTHKDIAWKSKKHDDGMMFKNYFIVGINTPAGAFTYHYHEEYWSHFNVQELDFAPPWDGHTARDISRLLSLEEGRPTWKTI